MPDDEQVPEAEDFAALLAGAGAGPALEVGQVVTGRIVQIDAETVFVDVHGKGEALVDRAELEDEQGVLGATVGSAIEATVIATGDEIRLSRKVLKGARARQALEVAAESGVPVQGKVTGINKGGYEVTVAGLRAFCPASQIDLRRVEAPDTYVGRVLDFYIARFAENGRNIVLSRRRLLEEQAARAAEETRKAIVPGAVLSGTVDSLAEFGAFVDLGGVRGLVPLSEVSHSRVVRPADRLRVGEAVAVKVLRVEPATGKVSLSLKALDGDPWAAVAAGLRERQVVAGRVVRMTEFGAFVELLPGVDGLLHTTEIPRHRQGAMKEAARSMAEVVVMVLSIDLKRRRIGLALAPEGAAPGEEVASAVSVGAVITGTVERVEPFGVFVRLGPGQVGLIPNAELGATRGADPHREFPPGAEVTVVVGAIEEGGRRIRLSRAQALAREEQAEVESYRRDAGKGKGGFGMTLGELLRQKTKR